MTSPQTSDTGTASQESYLLEFCRQAGLEYPGNRTLTIVCHGHSVPAGYFKTPDVRTFDSYPHLLHLELKRRFPCAVLNVIVTAIGGERSSAGAERFERHVMPLQPDLITIDYGLNDRMIGLENATRAWEQMIERALRENIKIILLTPTPDMNSDLSRPDDALGQHAEQIRGLAAKYNTGLTDSLAAFQEAMASGRKLESLMAQGNHPNRDGHSLVADRLLQWFPAIA